MILRNSLRGLLGLLPTVMATTTTPNTGDQEQGFLFGFPLPDLPNSLTLPLIQACPNPLTLSALSTTNNPYTSDPVAPYTMIMLVHEQLQDGANHSYERIYSRSMNVGDMSGSLDIDTPWMNGTQMIACIWAANGVSGGCQVGPVSHLLAVCLWIGPHDGSARSRECCSFCQCDQRVSGRHGGQLGYDTSKHVERASTELFWEFSFQRLASYLYVLLYGPEARDLWQAPISASRP